MKTFLTMMTILCLCVASVTLTSSAGNAPQPGEPGPMDPIAAQLFPPEAVMQHQKDVGLSEDQRRTMVNVISELQSRVLEAQWEMESQQQVLVEMLARPSIDESAALTQAGRLMDVERRIKTAHLAALIKIKNTLSPDQQGKLREALGRASSGERP